METLSLVSVKCLKKGGSSVEVDNITTELNEKGQVQLKDQGIKFPKLNDELVATSITEQNNEKISTEGAVYDELVKETVFEIQESTTNTEKLVLKITNNTGKEIVNETVEVDKVIQKVEALPTENIKNRIYELTKDGIYKKGFYIYFDNEWHNLEGGGMTAREEDGILYFESGELDHIIPDNTTVEIESNVLRIKDKGVGISKLANMGTGNKDKVFTVNENGDVVLGDSYTKTEVDTLLNKKSNVEDVYTKEESDAKYHLELTKKSFSKAYTVAASREVVVRFPEIATFLNENPDLELISIMRVNTGNTATYVADWQASSAGAYFTVKNLSTSAQTSTADITAIFIKKF